MSNVGWARLVERLGQRRVVAGGLTIMAGGLALLAATDVHTSYLQIAVALVVTATGMGLTTRRHPPEASCARCRCTKRASDPR